MKTCIALACLTICIALAAPGHASVSCRHPRTFDGYWFSISYPASFTVRPSLARKYGYEYSFDEVTALPKKTFDSAFFVSPDKSVEFYVFAPLLHETSAEFRLNPRKERLVARSDHSVRHTDLRPEATRYMTRAHWRTVRAKDGSYWRSWEELDGVDILGRRIVVGIKYRDQASFLKYRSEYLAFKRSLAIGHPCMS